MRLLTARLIIIAFMLMIAISAAALWWKPWSSPADKVVVNAIKEEAPTTCCELFQNPDRYYSKSVRVRAILLGYHELARYDSACKAPDKYIRADFDSASRKKLIKGIADLKGAGFKEGNFWAQVVLVGRFEMLAHAAVSPDKTDSKLEGHEYIRYQFRFVVLDVEHVSALPPDMTWPP
jgi:hypothetical protein